MEVFSDNCPICLISPCRTPEATCGGHTVVRADWLEIGFLFPSLTPKLQKSQHEISALSADKALTSVATAR